MKKILFICTGNTCRSAFAASYLRKLCENRKISEIEIYSAGTNTLNGMPASENAILAAKEFAVDLSSHRSTILSADLVDSADLVICMTKSHLFTALRISQKQKNCDKLKLLSEFSNNDFPDISDPFGGNLEIYRKCFLQISEAVDNLLLRSIKENKKKTRKNVMKNNSITDWRKKKNFVLAIAADHGGFTLKNKIVAELSARGIKILDLGPDKHDPCDDYSEFGTKLGAAVAKSQCDCGILICRSGVGMGIAANRFHNVRAAIANSTKIAASSRDHNCSNVLVLPGEYLNDDEAFLIINKWLETDFSAEERHVRRLLQIENDSYDEISAIRSVDPEIAEIIDSEKERQSEGIELIASENFATPAVRAAQGSLLTNKYAEGYPGKRYYNGCERVDDAESLAIKRACELFGAEAANVQPHSGSQANMAAYFALIQPGDTILAMDLAHGGHLTHGHPMNFSGMLYKVVPYGVSSETETLDYDNIAKLASEHKPKLIVAGASAYPRVFDFKRLREIADSIGAFLLVDMAHIAGLVAAGEHPSPIPYADIVTSTTHKTLRGPRSGLILCKEKYIKAVNSKVFPGLQGGPMMHTIAAKAICFKEAMSDAFKDYQRQVKKNAAILAQNLVQKGFRIVSGGTDNHLMLVDLRPKKTTGKVVAEILDKAGITVNKNMIPFDPEKPFVTSGIRIGTPAVTTRGMKEEEMLKIADWISKAVDNRENEQVLIEIKNEIKDFMKNFPLPQFINP